MGRCAAPEAPIGNLRHPHEMGSSSNHVGCGSRSVDTVNLFLFPSGLMLGGKFTIMGDLT